MADLLTHARAELKVAKETSDPRESHLNGRQAAEKAWGYVVDQTSKLTRLTIRGPAAHGARKDILAKIDRQVGTSLLRDYEELENRLHGDGFYDGRLPLEELEAHIRAAAEFPERLRAALKRVERR